MIKRNKELYYTARRIPVLVVCPGFSSDELKLLQSGLQNLSSEYSSEESEGIIHFLDEVKKCTVLTHPSEYAAEALKSISSSSIRYWSAFPFKITMGDYQTALNKMLDLYFQGSEQFHYEFPDISDLVKNSTIQNVDDYISFMDKLISQQNSIVLSYIYGTTELTGRVALTSCTGKTLNEKITEYICPVSKAIFKEKKSKNADMVIDRKAIKELFSMIIAGLEHSNKLESSIVRFRGIRTY
jgi:hypothetical protein